MFYSPSITTGVSFVYAEMPQTQFKYISGQSVNPIGIYQMASRTRNMKELIYHCEEDFILITSKTNIYIENANRQFKNKYVFYSPSITTGVSFVYAEMPQTQLCIFLVKMTIL